MDKKAMYKLSYGLFVLTAREAEKDNGCIINTAIQAASTPNQLSICVNKANYTHDMISRTGEFTVSIISQKASFDLFKHFGFQSGKDVNKFDGVEAVVKEGISVVADACSYLVCKVIDKMETATHTVFLGEVIAADVLKEEEPMTYAYYHKVVKGKSPKNAPTYIAEEEETVQKEEKWVCGICGYEYRGEIPFEEVPEQFVCPVCKQPKSVFVKK